MDLIRDINDKTHELEAAEAAKIAASAAEVEAASDTKAGKSIADYMADIASKDVDKT